MKFVFVQMSDRVKNILSYIDEDDSEEEQASTTSEKNPPQQASSTPTEEEHEQASVDDDLYGDDKKYKAYRRKLGKQKSFPCNIDGRIFNSEVEMKDYLKQLSKNKKTYNKSLKKDQITKTKMNIDKLEEIEDDYNLISDDNLIYKADRLYGFEMNGKLYKLPSTSTKDRKAIYNNVKKKGKGAVKSLIKAKDEEEFKQRTLDMVDEEEVKSNALNHINNNLNKDATWSKDSFLKLLEQEMNKKRAKKNTPATPSPATPSHPVYQSSSSTPNGFNPHLFKL